MYYRHCQYWWMDEQSTIDPKNFLDGSRTTRKKREKNLITFKRVVSTCVHVYIIRVCKAIEAQWNNMVVVGRRTCVVSNKFPLNWMRSKHFTSKSSVDVTRGDMAVKWNYRNNIHSNEYNEKSNRTRSDKLRSNGKYIKTGRSTICFREKIKQQNPKKTFHFQRSSHYVYDHL